MRNKGKLIEEHIKNQNKVTFNSIKIKGTEIILSRGSIYAGIPDSTFSIKPYLIKIANKE